MQINVLRLKTLLLNFLSNPGTIQWGKRLLFTTGILLFTSVQFAMVILPIRSRTVPVETDDAYTYILKAAEMRACFLQDCPALSDLREQLTVRSKDPNISWIRYREYVRAFSVYHPLHSLILTGLHGANLSWETSYNFVEIAGSLFLSLAICVWLYCLFGAGPAGIALILLAVTPFPNQGLHHVVPSNLALGIGMLTWGSLLKKHRNSHWILIGSTLTLVLMHPIGRLYALLGIFLFILLHAKQMQRTDWLFGALSTLLIVTTFVLPLVVTQPELSFPPDPSPDDWTLRLGYYNNITEAASFTTPWMRMYGGFPMVVLFIFVGLVSLAPHEQRTRIVTTLILLGGLLCASLLQVLPRYPAEAFGRIWVPSVIFLTGLIAHAIWRWIAAVIHGSRQALQNGVQDFRDEAWILSTSGWACVFLLLFGFLLAYNSFNNVFEGRRIFREELTVTIDTQNSRLDAEQPSVLLKAGCEDMLYMFEVPMHMYFVHGALACGAIYHPALAGTPEGIHWIQDNPNIGYVVTWNPTIKAKVDTGGNPLALERGDHLEFHLPEDWTSQQVYVYLENPKGDTLLGISPLSTEAGKKQKIVEWISLPPNGSGWQAINITADELAHGFSLNADQLSNAIYLRGIRSHSDSSLNWPWDQGLTLIHQRAVQDAPATEINFDTVNLVPYPNWSLTVVDDQGDTVLIKVDR